MLRVEKTSERFALGLPEHFKFVHALPSLAHSEFGDAQSVASRPSHTFEHRGVYMCIYIHIHEHIYTCIHIYIYVYLFVNINICVCLRTYHMYVHAHTHIHADFLQELSCFMQGPCLCHRPKPPEVTRPILTEALSARSFTELGGSQSNRFQWRDPSTRMSRFPGLRKFLLGNMGSLSFSLVSGFPQGFGLLCDS